MEFVSNYEIFSKTRGIIKVWPFWYAVYLPTCVHVLGWWLSSKLSARRGCVALWAQAIHSHLAWAFCMQKRMCRAGPLTHTWAQPFHTSKGAKFGL
jgi:hypothetical protein